MFSEVKMQSPLAKPLKILFYLGLASVFLTLGYGLGRGKYEAGTVDVVEGEVKGIGGQAPAWLEDDVNFSMFWDVWQLVQEQYVDSPTSDKDLFYAALQGLVWGLEDPYSTFFTPELAADFNQQLDGTFFGIGAEIGLDEDANVVVVSPIKKTPAERAGLRPGDRILQINGELTAGLSVNEAVEKIRGEKGTTVVLTLGRPDVDPIEVSIIRDEIKIDSVSWEVREDQVAVISVNMFNDQTASLFAKAVQEIQEQGVTELILDLRNNPGGYLDASIILAGYWVGDKVVVIEDTGEDKIDRKGMGIPLLADTQTVVLVNGGSASASEILAGALQDYNKATVIGEQSFGKGSVQEYRDLPDGSAIKITVARWLTPLGRSIDKHGIAPDQVVSYSLDEVHAGTDPQLEAALDFLQAN
ncbi:MAG: S41 family peptidase [Patescibacteria group bacterium]